MGVERGVVNGLLPHKIAENVASHEAHHRRQHEAHRETHQRDLETQQRDLPDDETVEPQQGPRRQVGDDGAGAGAGVEQRRDYGEVHEGTARGEGSCRGCFGLLTLGAHAQRGLQYLVCVCVCYPTSHFSRDYSCHKRY